MIIYTKHSFYSSKLEDFTVLGLIDKNEVNMALD